MLSRYVRWVVAALFLALASAQGAAAQTAEEVVAEASRAMGIEGLNSIRMYGSGANFTVGQNNNAKAPGRAPTSTTSTAGSTSPSRRRGRPR